MIYNPQNIFKCLSTQATYINPMYGNMYYFTDKAQLWVDTINNSRIQCNDIYILYYERERVNFIPSNYNVNEIYGTLTTNNSETALHNYIYVYVVESNCLYKYNFSSKTWENIYGIWGKDIVGQTYYPNGNIVAINSDDVKGNGILGDGSVVTRDQNMMICGILLSDGYSFYIKSLVGGQLNLDPSGLQQGEGCLQLNSATAAYLNGDLVIFGNIKVTDKNNWNKQYKVVTEDLQITSTTTIKAGSTIAKNSNINGTKYSKDTEITVDLQVTENSLIATNSKLYKGTVINGSEIKPPFIFDTDKMEMRSL